MKISSITPIISPQFKYEIKKNQTKNNDTSGSIGHNSVPFYNTISFQARVDKGLKRFYEVNADRMPKTLKSFIDKLPDKEMLTPLDANKLAFAALASVTTVAGIKAALPEDQDLVQEIKDIDESKATRGLLNTYRQNKDLFNKDKLVNNENLSVWLVKKIFLESKTIDEINEDFIKEVDPDFYSFYRESEPDGQAIRPSTLSALGIKMPEKEYMTSLRYTREGYSDAIHDILSMAQKIAWDKLSDDEKLARVTKFVLSVNKWWDSIPQDIKLDILASQDAELKLLKLYNERKKEKTERNEKKEASNTQNQLTIEGIKKEHINTGIKRDNELFKIWLKNNLAIKREQLTNEEKREIVIRQQQSRALHWDSMSTEEQIEYISRLKSGSEQLRFAMLDTWNNNPEIIIKLAVYLKKQNEKPNDMIYGTSEFSKHQSEIMKGFWATYPDFATKLGESIKEAHQRIKDAKKDGTFEDLKKIILIEKAEREIYVKNYLDLYKEIFTEEEYNSFPEYMRNFIDTYNENSMEYNKHLPVQYIKDFYNTVRDELSKEIVISWTKALNNEEITLEDELNIQQINQLEPPQAQKMNRAIEAAIADILYECTSEPKVYLLSQVDCKVALSQIDKGYGHISMHSNKTDKDIIINIKSHKIDDKKIEELYNLYKSPSDKVLDFICDYIKLKNGELTKELYSETKKYIQSYGRSIEKLRLDSKMPIEAKNAFLQKFLSNMPSEIMEQIECRLQNINDLKKEEQINRINNKIIRKYNFIPQEMLNAYLFETNKILRLSSSSDINSFEEACCKARKSASDSAKVAVLRRDFVRDTGNLFTFLCIEQVLADALYKATNEPKVYTLCLEELLDNMEIFNLIKRYPSEVRYIKPHNTNEEFELRLLRKLPLYKLNEKTADYALELKNYTDECIKENKPLDRFEIRDILSPMLGNEEIDEATMIRIDSIFELLQKAIETSRNS